MRAELIDLSEDRCHTRVWPRSPRVWIPVHLGDRVQTLFPARRKSR
jgi:hypothetical protein